MQSYTIRCSYQVNTIFSSPGVPYLNPPSPYATPPIPTTPISHSLGYSPRPPPSPLSQISRHSPRPPLSPLSQSTRGSPRPSLSPIAQSTRSSPASPISQSRHSSPPSLVSQGARSSPQPPPPMRSSPRLSPILTGSLKVSLQSPSRRNSLSPAISTLPAGAPQVNSLVEFCSPLRIHYDISDDPRTACIISNYGTPTALFPEESGSLVVEGVAPHTNFQIRFDHPAESIKTIKPGSALTIGGLIELLHSHLHKRLKSQEKATIESSIRLHPPAIIRQRKRCLAASNPDAEWNKGMRRIDALGDACKFNGVEMLAHDSDTITLRVKFGE